MKHERAKGQRAKVRRRQFLHLAGATGSLVSAHLAAGCSNSDGNTQPFVPDPDAGKPWWLRGNFSPTEESEALNLEVIGSLPPELRGVYVRNGPNPLSGQSGHWFLGDGMVHGVRLEDGAAKWYRSRYIQTPKLGALPDDGVQIPTLTEHEANTAIVNHAGKLLCLEEVGVPYEIKRQDLSTVGAHDFGGKLTTAMTAHPKIDPATGEMVFFGYGALPPYLTYHVADANGQLIKSEEIEVPAAVMMHDFQVTASHVIFMFLPIVFDLDAALAGDPLPFVWDPSLQARIGVMPRSGTNADVKWFDIDTCYVFHTFNAYNDPADNNRIVLDTVRYPEIWVDNNDDFTAPGQPWRWLIDLEGGISHKLYDDRRVEFPRIDPRRQGLVHRYGYGVSVPDSDSDDGAVDFTDSLVKVDFEKDSVETHKLKDGLRVGEATFVPASDNGAEDDGWLMAYAYDPAANSSQLVVMDASDMAAEPLARVILPGRVPYGFHGIWSSDS